MRPTGLYARRWGETLAVYPRYRPVDGKHLPLTCEEDANAGHEPRHAYSGLAGKVVAGWMDSPPHREILLSPMSQASVGIASTGDPYCGRVWVTMIFAG